MDPYNPQFPSDLALIQAAVQSGSLIGSGGTFGDNPTALCNLQLPAFLAGPWTLTLAAMRGDSAAGVTVPPDYNVNTDSTLFKVLLEWGVDGFADTAVIDYPWAGQVVTLFGSRIRASTQPASKTVGNNPPKVGAWLARGARGGRELAPPTFTQQVALDGGTGLATVLVPRHAKAYRVMQLDEDCRSFSITVQERQAAFGGVQICTDYFSGAGPVWDTGAPGPSFWVPLMSGCNQLLFNGSPGQPFMLQFAIDLG